MSKDIPFESLIVGQDLGPIEYVISKKDVEQYCEDWKDPNPLYLQISGSGQAMAPPAFRAGLDCFRLLRAGGYDAHATLGVSTEHEFINSVHIGKRLIVRGKIKDKYIKRGIEYVVIIASTVDEDGMKIRESVDHIALSVERITDDKL